MHINFFGDSWYWDWTPGGNWVNSKELINLSRLDFYKNLLSTLNHTSDNYCTPGSTPLDVIDVMHRNNPFKPGVSIVFYSHAMRSNSVNNPKSLWNHTTNYDKFKEKKQEFEINFIKELQRFSVKYKQKIYIVGGQAPFLSNVPKEFNNVEILSKDILFDLYKSHHTYDIDHKIGGYFRLATDITHIIDETWDKDLVIEAYNHIYEYEELTNEGGKYFPYVWPDRGHLNNQGHLLLLDLIFKKIEND